MTARTTKPRLVVPTALDTSISNAEYERRIRIGALGLRREVADQCRRAACDATQRGDDGEAFRLHAQADRSEAEIERLMREISEIRA